MRAALGSDNLFEPWVELRDASTAAALASEATEQESNSIERELFGLSFSLKTA